ncbi:MAG: N-6 DNA methylase [Oscillospiraceae bacterium]|nr:N-6 DNA methylase [Oscillospiraceae bacterium]MBR3536857.1 N-6 DNA methylase [Oscillospiraceae bacterium]MBR4344196.1 N-6 DNA methylase [Lachnospiraceae bacterium]MBR6834463.1 N-6 DNA methylase [Oscillospiraceae bacterium]
MASVEEKVEEFYKSKLDELSIRHYAKTEKINDSIDDALKNADSKSGNKGNNYPDIRLLLENKHRRNIPVMIEAKGSKGKLEKLKDGEIELVSSGSNPNSAVMNYAVNGALHYGNAILNESTYKEVIIIGINGSALDENGDLTDAEIKAYYVSEKNNRVPKEIKDFDLVQMTDKNIDDFYALLDTLNLTDAELEKLKRNKEEILEKNIKDIHQRIYDDNDMKNLLSTNDKLYFFCGLIMAGLSTEGVKPLNVDDLPSNNDEEDNDGQTILKRTRSFLNKKHCSKSKVDMIVGYLKPVFEKPNLWKPKNGESIIKSVYKQIKSEILPLLESNLHLDFTGKILNSLNDWVTIENDKLNDVVLTPRFVTNLMARITRTDKDSFVWDTCMGSSGFLVSSMDLMITDAKSTIKDADELDTKIKHIKEQQLLGIEILGNIYILAVLNMILMGDGSSQIICGDSHNEIKKHNFPANVFLLNPPYSAPGKGLVFVDEALSRMEKGYGAVLIQENAGSGQGDVYSKRLLQKNTLVASIHMPADLFSGKSSVQTAIYLFQVNRPHEEDDVVTFIDFGEDGYSRQNRKKSTQEVNLRNTDHALERYDEVAALCLGKKPKTNYYTEANEKVIKDTISLEGNDWTFNQHKIIDTTPTEEDFKKTVADYLAWKVATILKGQVSADE